MLKKNKKIDIYLSFSMFILTPSLPYLEEKVSVLSRIKKKKE